MKSFQLLHTNTTNRLTCSSHAQSTLNSASLLALTAQYRSLSTMDRQNLSATLVKEARCLTEQIAEAEIEKKLMSNLLADIIKREQGQCSEAVKRKRRCANEIIVKFACKHQSCNKLYSSETSLAKHIKLKHSCVKVDPPQPYYQLHPNPNLTHPNTNFNIPPHPSNVPN